MKYWDRAMDEAAVGVFLHEPWEGVNNGARVYFRKFLLWYANSYGVPRQITLADLGCGGGIELEGYLIDGLNIAYTGVDYSQVMISYCEKKFTIDICGVLTPHKFVSADITNTSFPDSSFDVVLCRHVLEHQSYYHEIVREAKRISREVVVIDFYEALAKEDLLRPFHDIYDNCYDETKFRGFLKEEGLTIADEQKFHYEQHIADRCDHLFILRKD